MLDEMVGQHLERESAAECVEIRFRYPSRVASAVAAFSVFSTEILPITLLFSTLTPSLILVV